MERKYDIAICHAFLLHVPNPMVILKKMIDCVVDTGKVITFEPHWIFLTNSEQHSTCVECCVLDTS
nr:hypothetical protein [Paenibacillus alba]